jgi:hypothetical protein
MPAGKERLDVTRSESVEAMPAQARLEVVIDHASIASQRRGAGAVAVLYRRQPVLQPVPHGPRLDTQIEAQLMISAKTLELA